jgi:8-oxo-dGTP pyrophosphatase MutT (NUDIX family)
VRVDKVAAFVLRADHGQPLLLVFDHPPADGAEASVQVPAGTVEPGEAPAAAVVREVEEETGLTGVRLVRELGAIPALAPGEWMIARARDGTPLGRGQAVSVTGSASGPTIEISRGSWRGAVSRDALTQDSTRYLFQLELGGSAPERWRHPCDCGAPLTLYWVPLDRALLHPRQQHWLDAARARLTAPR